ncbi:MAG: hypothetical protein JWM95_4412 [Gemmatimonadetes bacterium]|nr:hypothetical protein [Gemmatimonadota bacterium]
MKRKQVVKRIASMLLALATLGRRRSPQPANIRRVLVVQLGLLGDVLLITPMLRALRAGLPSDARITVMVPPGSVSALRNNPDVHELLAYDAFWADPRDNHRHRLSWRHIRHTWRFVREQRAQAYDLIINCWIMDQPMTWLVLSFMDARYRLGFDFPFSRRYCDAVIPFRADAHVADNVMALAAGVVDTSAPHSLQFFAAHESGVRMATPYIVVSPFSSESAKEWSVQSWAAVLSTVAREHPNMEFVLTGLADARARADELMAVGMAPMCNVVGELTLDQFAQVLQHATAVVTAESGTAHLASALGTPTFVMYSRMYNFRQFVPYRVPHAYSAIDVPCAECIHGCEAMRCMQHDPTHVARDITRFLSTLATSPVS